MPLQQLKEDHSYLLFLLMMEKHPRMSLTVQIPRMLSTSASFGSGPPSLVRVSWSVLLVCLPQLHSSHRQQAIHLQHRFHQNFHHLPYVHSHLRKLKA